MSTGSNCRLLSPSVCKKLSKYVLPNLDPETLQLGFDAKDSVPRYRILQEAFIKTYPSNLCMLADTEKKYPYYLLVKSKELMKIHGSSISQRMAFKPKWICCQNIVISSVTEREMTKVIIPIEQDLLDHMPKTNNRQLKKMMEKYTIEKIEYNAVPTALLRIYRRKNRIDKFKEILRENKIYLETEEEIEKVLYFVLTTKDSHEDCRKKVDLINEQIIAYSKNLIKKRHALIKISERTKIQVNEAAQIIDILNNTQYLGLLIKSANKAALDAVERVRREGQRTLKCLKELQDKDRTTDRTKIVEENASDDGSDDQTEKDSGSETKKPAEQMDDPKPQTPGQVKAKKSGGGREQRRYKGHLPDDQINIETDKSSDISFIYLLNKHLARSFFFDLSEIFNRRNPPIGCTPLSPRLRTKRRYRRLRKPIQKVEVHDPLVRRHPFS